jgi:hypothetical protein
LLAPCHKVINKSLIESSLNLAKATWQNFFTTKTNHKNVATLGTGSRKLKMLLKSDIVSHKSPAYAVSDAEKVTFLAHLEPQIQ